MQANLENLQKNYGHGEILQHEQQHPITITATTIATTATTAATTITTMQESKFTSELMT